VATVCGARLLSTVPMPQPVVRLATHNERPASAREGKREGKDDTRREDPDM